MLQDIGNPLAVRPGAIDPHQCEPVQENNSNQEGQEFGRLHSIQESLKGRDLAVVAGLAGEPQEPDPHREERGERKDCVELESSKSAAENQLLYETIRQSRQQVES